MKIKKLKKKESGQAAVEFALVMPFFLIIIFLIIDFGWLFYNMISVETAARNAARDACVSQVQYTSSVDEGGTASNTYESDQVICYDPVRNRPTDKVLKTNDELVGDYTEAEKNIIDVVKDSLPGNLKNTAEITVVYSNDVNYKVNASGTQNMIVSATGTGTRDGTYELTKRANGNVTVKVSVKMKAFSKLIGNVDDDFYRHITTSSTFKVESSAFKQTNT